MLTAQTVHEEGQRSKDVSSILRTARKNSGGPWRIVRTMKWCRESGEEKKIRRAAVVVRNGPLRGADEQRSPWRIVRTMKWCRDSVRSEKRSAEESWWCRWSPRRAQDKGRLFVR